MSQYITNGARLGDQGNGDVAMALCEKDLVQQRLAAADVVDDA